MIFAPLGLHEQPDKQDRRNQPCPKTDNHGRHGVAFGADSNTTAGIEGQVFVFFIMVVAAAEVTVGLAIIVMMYRNTHSIDVNFLNRLKN